MLLLKFLLVSAVVCHNKEVCLSKYGLLKSSTYICTKDGSDDTKSDSYKDEERWHYKIRRVRALK